MKRRFAQKWNHCEEHFTLIDVTHAINELKVNKDPGPMGISSNYVQHNSAKLAPIICYFLTKILQFGIIPDEWKESYIDPIPEKGSPNLATNYRGIALQSVLPKLLDKVLTKKLQFHLDSIIPHTQHGFRQKRSTVTNLLQLTDYIHTEIHRGNQVDVVYFDFSKAFDTIDHHLLGKKLADRSTPFFLYLATMSFVINRRYTLKINGNILPFTFVTQSAVPQGSHCGPLLFILMPADIAEITQNNAMHQLSYADDTKFYGVVNNLNDQEVLQDCVDKLYEWSIANHIKLNPTKTEYVSYTTKRKNPFQSRYYIQQERITQKYEVKDLGVIFDSKLTFGPHIQNLILKSNRITAMAYRLATELNMPMMTLKINQIYLKPIIVYASTVWNQDRRTINTKLEKSLHSASRTALRTPYRNDYPNYVPFEERMNTLQILTFRDIQIIAAITLAKTLIQNDADLPASTYLKSCINLQTRKHFHCPEKPSAGKSTLYHDDRD